MHAIPEGSVCFPNEPLIRITAPLPQAQLVESRLINILHYQTLIASKAARMVLAAPGKILSDFGLRTAHGAEAGLYSARASYIAGFAGAANVLAGERYGVPIVGTMAHSFVQVHDDEMTAFENFARARPRRRHPADRHLRHRARRAQSGRARAAPEGATASRSAACASTRGDLTAMARKVRAILDAGGLKDVIILVSGGINEDVLQSMMKDKAPIDGFGIGVNLAASVDVPALDCAYKLQEYAGTPKRKLSEGKATWPGRKQVWRAYDADGRMRGDILSLESDKQPGEALIVPVMRGGKRIAPAPTLAQIRERAARDLARLPGTAGAARTGLRLSGERRGRAQRAGQTTIDAAKARRLKSFAGDGGVPRSIPAARALAVDLVARVGHHHGVLQLDEAARRMLERGLDRHHRADFQRNVGVVGRIRHRPVVGEPRRLVADHAHAVRQELDVVVVLRLHHQRLGGGIDLAAQRARAHRLERGALDAFDLGQQIVELGIRLALDRHAADVADIAVIVAAASRST